MAILKQEGNRLIYRFDDEVLWIEPWGRDSLRVRATRQAEMPEEDGALLPPPDSRPVDLDIREQSGGAARAGQGDGGAGGGTGLAGEVAATLRNGRITCRITAAGKLTFTNRNGTVLLDEYVRNRTDLKAEYCSALNIDARELRPIPGGAYALTMRFESDRNEKIFGMGQYQQDFLDLKGAELELAHRNSQASVPFLLSSLGYGFLWNNPAIGRVTFGKNLTTWHAGVTDRLDYWITAGDTPAQIEEAYASVTGTVPMMPEYGMGFWQCKLRYRTQEELLAVAREHKRRNLPLSVIVVDYFHWPLQGEWKFDPTYWPDPKAMIRELHDMGVELMVSVWPTVDYKCENFDEMREKGYLVRTDRGVRVMMFHRNNTVFFDPTNPEARDYVWGKLKKNYFDLGVKTFWLDEAEPEYAVYDFDNYRYHKGPNVRIGNLYPRDYMQTVFDGLRSVGVDNPVNLIRCAWAGSQRYGALVWSGDIHSSFSSMRNQMAAGLNMAIAGIPWWTTDIGGFHGGDPNDPAFRELFARWFAYATFCPVMRMHGDRDPKQPKLGTTGGADCLSGADNEVWSYGDEVLEICTKYMRIRERMKPYITELMKAAHEKGTPVMRPLFYDHPEDPEAWTVENQFQFGPDLLVAPVAEAGAAERDVYLPEGGSWTDVWSKTEYEGGQTIRISTPLECIPVFTSNPDRMGLFE